MEFLYPAPLSSLEFIRAVRDIRTRIASLEHFQATPVSVRWEIATGQNNRLLA
jgi:hypothetical protein